MKSCPNCGLSVPQGVVYCPNCKSMVTNQPSEKKEVIQDEKHQKSIPWYDSEVGQRMKVNSDYDNNSSKKNNNLIYIGVIVFLIIFLLVLILI